MWRGRRGETHSQASSKDTWDRKLAKNISVFSLGEGVCLLFTPTSRSSGCVRLLFTPTHLSPPVRVSNRTTREGVCSMFSLHGRGVHDKRPTFRCTSSLKYCTRCAVRPEPTTIRSVVKAARAKRWRGAGPSSVHPDYTTIITYVSR